MLSHVLIVLCGMSPAVLTETLWALRDDLPDKIVVITTIQGAAVIRRELFDSGIWNRFRQKFYADKMVYFGDNAASIRLIPQHTWTKDAADIQTNDDIEEFADFLLDQLRQYTENTDVRLTFSISGGRKTMSAIGALCISLLGRHCDRLCHVLVNFPFDSNDLQPHFFFPDCHNCYMLPDGSIYNDSNAKIILCDIPYVHQRYIFGEHITQYGSYRNLVASANGILNGQPSAVLQVAPQKLQLQFLQKSIILPFREFMLYYFLVMRRKDKLPALRGTTALYEEFYDTVRSWPKNDITDKFADHHGEIMEKMNVLQAEDLRKVISAITRCFRKNQIPINSGIYPSTLRGIYGLSIDPAKICIEKC